MRQACLLVAVCGVWSVRARAFHAYGRVQGNVGVLQDHQANNANLKPDYNDQNPDLLIVERRDLVLISGGLFHAGEGAARSPVLEASHIFCEFVGHCHESVLRLPVRAADPRTTDRVSRES
jgi:hypothetical protein